jgi:RNA polymerase sigma factor (sigma-70 family)
MPTRADCLLRCVRRVVSQSSPELDDAELLRRFLTGRSPADFEVLVARHGPMVLAVCRRVLGNADDAEDAFQATFLVLAKKAASVRPALALAAWLYGVACRVARGARYARSLRRGREATAVDLAPPDPHPDPLAQLTTRETLAILDEEVSRLPLAYRLPVLLCCLEGFSQEEVAARLGWTPGSVKGRLERGRARLHARLLRRGLTLSAALAAAQLVRGTPTLATAATARAVLAVAAGRAGAVTARAGVWAEACCRGAALGKAKVALALVLALGTAALGAGLIPPPAPDQKAPAAVTPAPPPQPNEERRRDRHGDPLPEGAVARLGTLRFRVPGEVEALTVSPDGKVVAASSRAGVFLFDAADGLRLRRLPASDFPWGAAKLLTFSLDGKRLAGRGGVVRVWDVAGGRNPQDYDVKNVAWLGWSSGGKALALCLEKGSIHLRDLASGTSRRFLCEGLQRPDWYDHTPLACTMSGQTLAVADDSRHAVHVWDTADGQLRRVLRPKDRRVSSLALSPDGTRLAAATAQGEQRWEKDLQVWDLTTGKPLYTVPCKNDEFRSPRFSADGKTLVVADYWPHVCFLDAATGRERGRTDDKYAFSCLSLSSDGRTLVASERSSGSVHMFDVATGKRKPQPVGHFNPGGVAFSPDGRRVTTTGGQDGSVLVWEPATGKPLQRIQRSDKGVREAIYSADGRSLYVGWNDGNLWVCDTATGEKRHVIKLEDPEWPDTYQDPFSMHLADSGKTLVVISVYASKKDAGGPRHPGALITGWDVSTRQQRFRRRHYGPGSVPTLTADGRVMARNRDGGLSGPMRLEDAATGEELVTFPTSPQQVWPLAFSPDGRLVATNTFDYKDPSKRGPLDPGSNTVRLWETATAAEVLALPDANNTRGDPNTRAAFSPDGRLLAVAAPYHDIVLWEVAGAREVRRFKGSGAAVRALAFSPDGRLLTSGLADATWLVWDVGPGPSGPTSRLGPEAAARAWEDLAGADAPRAFRARWALASSRQEAMALLKDFQLPTTSHLAIWLRSVTL